MEAGVPRHLVKDVSHETARSLTGVWSQHKAGFPIDDLRRKIDNHSSLCRFSRNISLNAGKKIVFRAGLCTDPKNRRVLKGRRATGVRIPNRVSSCVRSITITLTFRIGTLRSQTHFRVDFGRGKRGVAERSLSCKTEGGKAVRCLPYNEESCPCGLFRQH